MNASTTLDTNILVYAFDDRDLFKHRMCKDIVAAAVTERRPVALQALGEFYVATVRKGILTPQRAAAEVEQFISDFDTFPPSPSAYLFAAREAARGTFSYWDAVLLLSASEAGCDIILSEDMKDGARLGHVTVRNPFGPRGLNDEARRWLGMDEA
jgi:predicted nucleic acid-binding protein